MSEWVQYPGGTVTEHNLDLKETDSEPAEFRASVRWDGCVHLHQYHNGADPERHGAEFVAENSDYVHICDLDRFIQLLQALRAEADKHFNGWPG